MKRLYACVFFCDCLSSVNSSVNVYTGPGHYDPAKLHSIGMQGQGKRFGREERFKLHNKTNLGPGTYGVCSKIFEVNVNCDSIYFSKFMCVNFCSYKAVALSVIVSSLQHRVYTS